MSFIVQDETLDGMVMLYVYQNNQDTTEVLNCDFT